MPPKLVSDDGGNVVIRPLIYCAEDALAAFAAEVAKPDNLRPTGLALQLLNRVAGGEARAVSCRGSACAKLTAIAFAGGRSLAVVSSLAQPAAVDAMVSCGGATVTIALLDGSRPELNNESGPQVRITESDQPCQNDRVRFTLPAFSLAVITK